MIENEFFFQPNHREIRRQLDDFTSAHSKLLDVERHDEEEHALEVVRALGEAKLLELVVPAAYGGRYKSLDVRALCLSRERLAYASSLADLMFGMQGLGSY